MSFIFGGGPGGWVCDVVVVGSGWKYGWKGESWSEREAVVKLRMTVALGRQVCRLSFAWWWSLLGCAE